MNATPRTPRSTASKPHLAPVVAISNQKGGVAKTTTAASLAAAWVEAGRTALLVDLDPQACLTFSLGYDPETLDASLIDVMTGETELSSVILPTEDGPDLLPATLRLVEAERASYPAGDLAQLLEPIRAAYDVIVIDCPPSLGSLTVAGLTAATAVLVPLQCETLAHRGVGQLLDTIYDVRASTNPELEMLGVLPTLFDARTKHARLVVEHIGEDYGVTVLGPPIPKSIRFAEAPAAGRSILAVASASKGAQAYRQVAQTLGERLF